LIDQADIPFLRNPSCSKQLGAYVCESVVLNIVNVLSYYMSEGKNKRIPVSENVWKRLGELKGAGETYDEVIEKMIKDHNRMELARKMKKIEETEKKELVPLEKV